VRRCSRSVTGGWHAVIQTGSEQEQGKAARGTDVDDRFPRMRNAGRIHTAVAWPAVARTGGDSDADPGRSARSIETIELELGGACRWIQVIPCGCGPPVR